MKKALYERYLSTAAWFFTTTKLFANHIIAGEVMHISG
jgi:hypothetical protein